MSRFSTETTARINFEADTKNLESILQQLQKGSDLNLSDNLRKDLKALEIETKQFIDNVANMKPEDMTVDMMKELAKKEKELIAKADKINQRILSGVSKSTSAQVKLLEDEIKVLDEEIAQSSQELEKLERKFEVDPVDPDSRQFAQKSTETEFLNAKVKELGIEKEILGVSGKNVKNVRTFLEHAEDLEKTLGKNKDVYKEINGLYDSGLNAVGISLSLSEEQREIVQKNLTDSGSKLTVDEAIQQVVMKRMLEEEKEKYLLEEKLRIDNLSLDIADKQTKIDNKKKQIEKEITKAKQNTTDEQKKQLEYSNELCCSKRKHRRSKKKSNNSWKSCKSSI